MQSLSNTYDIFHRTRWNNPKIYMWFLFIPQKTLSSQSNVEKNNAGSIISLTSNCSTKLQKSTQCVAGTKTEHISVEQDGEPRNNPCTYGQLIYDKRGKNIWWTKHSLFSKWCLENWTATCKRMKLKHFHTIYKGKLKVD